MAHSLAWLRSTSWPRRAVDAVELLARTGSALAIGVALLTLLIAGSSFLTGLAAMDGSVETAWIVLGGTLLVDRRRRPAARLVATPAGPPPRHRPRRARSSASPAAARRPSGSSSRPSPSSPAPAGPTTPAVVGQTAQFSRLRTIAVDAGDLRELPGALRAVTMFPLMLAIALLLCLVFAILGFLFLVAWAL